MLNVIIEVEHCVKCPNTEFFLVRTFPDSELPVFPNAEKYGPEKSLCLDTFLAVEINRIAP